MARELQITGLSGHLATVTLHDHMEIQDLKEVIAAKTGIEEHVQRFLVGDKEIRSTSDLRALSPGEDLNVSLVRRSFSSVAYLREMMRYEAPSWLRSAPDSAKEDREIVLTCATRDGHSLRFAPQWHNDREIVLAAATSSGMSLRDLPAEFRADREVVLAAVRSNGQALQYASEELRADREVVLAAVSKEGMAWRHAAPTLQEDREIVLAAVANDYLVFQRVGQELQADREVARVAVTNNHRAAEGFTEDLRQDREVKRIVNQASRRENWERRRRDFQRLGWLVLWTLRFR